MLRLFLPRLIGLLLTVVITQIRPPTCPKSREKEQCLHAYRFIKNVVPLVPGKSVNAGLLSRIRGEVHHLDPYRRKVNSVNRRSKGKEAHMSASRGPTVNPRRQEPTNSGGRRLQTQGGLVLPHSHLHSFSLFFFIFFLFSSHFSPLISVEVLGSRGARR